MPDAHIISQLCITRGEREGRGKEGGEGSRRKERRRGEGRRGEEGRGEREGRRGRGKRREGGERKEGGERRGDEARREKGREGGKRGADSGEERGEGGKRRGQKGVRRGGGGGNSTRLQKQACQVTSVSWWQARRKCPASLSLLPGPWLASRAGENEMTGTGWRQHRRLLGAPRPVGHHSLWTPSHPPKSIRLTQLTARWWELDNGFLSPTPQVIASWALSQWSVTNSQTQLTLTGPDIYTGRSVTQSINTVYIYRSICSQFAHNRTMEAAVALSTIKINFFCNL